MTLSGSTGPDMPNTCGIELNGFSTLLYFNADGTVNLSLDNFNTRERVYARGISMEEAARIAAERGYPVISRKPSWML